MYGFGLLKGLKMTMRHFFKPPVTVQFPEEVRDFPARARTSHARHSRIAVVSRAKHGNTCALSESP